MGVHVFLSSNSKMIYFLKKNPKTNKLTVSALNLYLISIMWHVLMMIAFYNTIKEIYWGSWLKKKRLLLFCITTPDVLFASAWSVSSRHSPPHSNTDDIIVRMKCALFTWFLAIQWFTKWTNSRNIDCTFRQMALYQNVRTSLWFDIVNVMLRTVSYV